ncbi:MAG TPA: hypothetical protein VGK29_19030 [Paludibaculum sp.]|jgi:hypothetical protein
MRVTKWIVPCVVAVVLALPGFAQQAGRSTVLWLDRGDVAGLNLLEGPGGKARAPGSSFKFIKESKEGTSPKFVVEDENGVKWKVKLGPEAKPETAAARLLWATGYYVDEDYFRAQIRVEGLKPMARAKKYVSKGGVVREARLEREDEKKANDWSWYGTGVGGTREFNGLKVMMALINNWDLKEVNNSVYMQGGVVQRYVVSDLGASFGRTGSNFSRSKGVLKDYAGSKFVRKVTQEHVDFVMHDRPFFLLYVFNHPYYKERAKMESVTKHIPIDDARWLGARLGQFSTAQIGDCFRAAGYGPVEVEGFTRVVMQRIDALKKL